LSSGITAMPMFQTVWPLIDNVVNKSSNERLCLSFRAKTGVSDLRRCTKVDAAISRQLPQFIAALRKSSGAEK
jgi:hypothetical protein